MPWSAVDALSPLALSLVAVSQAEVQPVLSFIARTTRAGTEGNAWKHNFPTVPCCPLQLAQHHNYHQTDGLLDDPPTAAPGASMTKDSSIPLVPADGVTQYTIDVDVHPDVETVAVKHARQDNLSRYLENHSISQHTREAYAESVGFVRAFYMARQDGSGRKREEGLWGSRRQTTAQATNRDYSIDLIASGKGLCQVGAEEVVPPPGHESSRRSGRHAELQKQQRLYHVSRQRYPVVLDSGCGTGRSSAWLAEIYPHLPVIGVDRSGVRLSKGGSDAWTSRRRWKETAIRKRDHDDNGEHRAQTSATESPAGIVIVHGARNQTGTAEGTRAGLDKEEKINVSTAIRGQRITEKEEPQSRNRFTRTTRGEESEHRSGNRRGKNDAENRPPPTNLLLLRADLVDFWILASRDDVWNVEEHFVLYPNPYPKRSQLRRRWHGHPVFPIMLGLGGRITLRSNWKGYLDEACQAVLAIHDDAEKINARAEQAGSRKSIGMKERRDAPLAGHRNNVVNSTPPATTDVKGTFLAGREGHDATVAACHLGRVDLPGACPSNLAGNGGTVFGAGGNSSSIGRTEVTVQQEAHDNCSRGVGDAETKEGSTAVTAAAAAASAMYADSARAGPVSYFPTTPVTNFEAKYKAAGESVYELRLEPRTNCAYSE